MAFRILVLPSYDRCRKKLGSRERHIAGLIVLALEEYFQSEFYAANQPYYFETHGRSYRLVFKKLRDPFWEAYIEGQVRVVTRLEKDCHYLFFAGNHDQVRQFLKKN